MASPRTRKRRVLLGAIASIALIPMLAACGSTSSGGSAGKVEGSKIVFQTLSSLEPQFKQYAAAYMKKYPKRKVEIRGTTDDAGKYTSQLATAAISHKLPDLFINVDFLVNTISKAHVPLDMTAGIKAGKLKGLKLKDFLPQFVGQYRPTSNPDDVTGLPVSADSVGLYYNKALFAKYGVETPQKDWTWQDMYKAGEEIQTKSAGKVIGLGAPLSNGDALIIYQPLINAYGGTVYDPKTNKSGIASPEALKAWKLLISAYGTVSNAYNANADDPSLSFSSGNVAMAVASRGAVPQTKSKMTADWDVQVMPTANGKSTAGGGSYGISMAQTGKNQDAAWAFLSWFYNTNGGMKLAQKVGGIIPPTNDGIDNGTWKDVTPPPAHIAIFGQSARTAVLPVQMPGSSSSVMSTATVEATQQVVLNGVSIEKAFKTAQDKVDAQLAIDGKKKK